MLETQTYNVEIKNGLGARCALLCMQNGREMYCDPKSVGAPKKRGNVGGLAFNIDRLFLLFKKITFSKYFKMPLTKRYKRMLQWLYKKGRYTMIEFKKKH